MISVNSEGDSATFDGSRFLSNTTNTTKPVVASNTTSDFVNSTLRTFTSAEGRYEMGDLFTAPKGVQIFRSNGLEGYLNSTFAHSPTNNTFSSKR